MNKNTHRENSFIIPYSESVVHAVDDDSQDNNSEQEKARARLFCIVCAFPFSQVSAHFHFPLI